MTAFNFEKVRCGKELFWTVLAPCGISSYNPETDEAIGSKSVAALDRVVPPVRSISEECVQCTILPGCPGCRHEFYCQSFSRSFQLLSRFCVREARSALSSGCRLWPLFGESILSSQDRRMLSPAFGWRLEEPERLIFKCCAEVKTSWHCKTHSGTLMILEHLCIVTKPAVSVFFTELKRRSIVSVAMRRCAWACRWGSQPLAWLRSPCQPVA